MFRPFPRMLALSLAVAGVIATGAWAHGSEPSDSVRVTGSMNCTYCMVAQTTSGSDQMAV